MIEIQILIHVSRRDSSGINQLKFNAFQFSSRGQLFSYSLNFVTRETQYSSSLFFGGFELFTKWWIVTLAWRGKEHGVGKTEETKWQCENARGVSWVGRSGVRIQTRAYFRAGQAWVGLSISWSKPSRLVNWARLKHIQTWPYFRVGWVRLSISPESPYIVNRAAPGLNHCFWHTIYYFFGQIRTKLRSKP